MTRVGCLTCSKADLARRDFLRVGSIGCLGLRLSQFLELESAMAAHGATARGADNAESCIMLWLGGGPSQVDTWDPKTNSGFQPISTNVEGIQISELLTAHSPAHG